MIFLNSNLDQSYKNKIFKYLLAIGNLNLIFTYITILSGETCMENREFDGYTPMKRLVEKLPSVAEVISYINELQRPQ